MADDAKIPKGRVRRSAKLGSLVGVQGARYAGTRAAGVARSEEGARERLDNRHHDEPRSEAPCPSSRSYQRNF